MKSMVRSRSTVSFEVALTPCAREAFIYLSRSPFGYRFPVACDS
jgi:hypothetical protein